jgi:nucleoside-diphosphate-sugar epimerase
VDALLARGATVRALVRAETPERALDPRVEECRVDLADDRSVREASLWEGATHVYHLAGATKRRTLGEFRFANVLPTANVLSAVAARAGETAPRVVLVSSQAAAGPATAADRPVREDDPTHPIEGYGRSKLEAEAAVRGYEGRIPVSIVRPGAVYGPRDRDFMRVFKLAARPMAIHAVPRDNAFSIVHVRDVVSAILLAGKRREAIGRTYFVANEAPTTWGDLYALVAQAADVIRAAEIQIPLPAVALAGLAGDVVSALTGWHSLANGNKTSMARPRWWLCDASRVRAELGWAESVGLREGVRETYLWYLDAGWMRERTPRTGPSPSEESQA